MFVHMAKNQGIKAKLNSSEQCHTALALVRCPPASQIFQGRKEILDKMQQYFSQEPKRRIFVLYGLGGSGKTQVALKFLESIDDFTKRFFVNASSPEALKTSFMNIGISQSFGKTSEVGLEWLISENKEWTLLFDNADDPKLKLSSFFPQCTHGNIIITSRNPQLAAYGPASHSHVGDLDEENAALLLLERAVASSSGDDFMLNQDAQELSCLPLAIVQAGAYIAKFKCLINYLSIYRQNKEELLRQHPDQAHDNYDWTVYTTWQISFQKLSPVAAYLLQLCALLHHSNIPQSIFANATQWILNNEGNETESMREVRKFLQNFVSRSGNWSKQYFRNIVAEIEEYSLIQSREASDTLDMHPLVHLWCSSTLADEVTTRACMANVVGMTIDVGPNAYLERIRMIAHVNMLVPDFTVVVDSQFWSQYAWMYYEGGRFEHAKGLYELDLQRQREAPGSVQRGRAPGNLCPQSQKLLGEDHPDTLSAMANLALTYQQLGWYREAEPLQISVLERRQKFLGEDHPDTLSAMANLAGTYGQLGRYREAVLKRRQKLLGEDHPHMLLAMANLAATCRLLGRYQEAEPLELSVLTERQKLLGEDHPDTLRAMANLAVTYGQLGRYREAEPLEISVLERRQKLLGEDHPHTLLAMANLAATYRQLGRYQEAEPLELSVLTERQKLLGEDHPDTLRAMANLAATYGQLGRYREAELLELSVLKESQKLLGEHHPDTLRAMANLAFTYRLLGRYQEAEPLQLSVLKQRQKFLGEAHPDTLIVMANLAVTYGQLGHYRQAELLELSVLERRQKLLGEDHPDMLRAMANLAATYGHLGRYREAEPLGISVLKESQKLLGEDHPDTLRAMAHLAAIHRLLGRYQEAELLELSVLERHQKLLGEDHPATLIAMASLAVTYGQLGHYREAELLKLSVLERHQKLLGEDHPDTLRVMANLAATYRQLGRYQEAERLKLSVLKESQKLLGEDHPDTLIAMANLAMTLYSTGRHQEVENLQLKVVAKHRDVLGPDHPLTLQATKDLKATQDALAKAKGLQTRAHVELDGRDEERQEKTVFMSRPTVGSGGELNPTLRSDSVQHPNPHNKYVPADRQELMINISPTLQKPDFLERLPG
ncbi:hypothetical protein FB45DRAFT_1007550 [Roridomyces roridus]|uniref:TPR-like protein n=1 Tax=Roridomyces roridus TaxID=1738132 RepID=A0AAD7BE29_9AGAR|nr:hypothetical protein FB45DRAFT_1007550 [Roridomyces roridus]